MFADNSRLSLVATRQKLRAGGDVFFAILALTGCVANFALLLNL